MAVTLTVDALAAALRLGSTAEETAEATRLLAYATEAVTQHAADAPNVIHNEAVVRLAAYLFDQPTAGRGDGFANAMRNSGAGRILLPYVMHGAMGVSGAMAAAQAAMGTASNPVTGIALSGSTLTITFQDNTTETITLPASGNSGGGSPVLAGSWQTPADGLTARMWSVSAITPAATASLIGIGPRALSINAFSYDPPADAWPIGWFSAAAWRALSTSGHLGIVNMRQGVSNGNFAVGRSSTGTVQFRSWPGIPVQFTLDVWTM